MRLVITVDVDTEESGLNPDEVKDNIVEFTRDLLIRGAEEQGIGLTLREVEYRSVNYQRVMHYLKKELALSALEKQIPKKPVIYKETNRADCPICGATVRGINKSLETGVQNADRLLIGEVRHRMKNIISSISTIKNFMANASRTTCNEFLYEALQDAVEIMEKQIPKKPIDDKSFGSCPNCHSEFNSELINEYNMKYCLHCGQALETGG